MKKIIFLLLLTGTLYCQYDKGNQTPLNFFSNYKGTATTSSGTATLNTIAGIVTSDNASGNVTAEVTINNSNVTENSIILVTAYSADHPDVVCFLRGVNAGSFTVIANRFSGSNFDVNPKIHFLIIN